MDGPSASGEKTTLRLTPITLTLIVFNLSPSFSFAQHDIMKCYIRPGGEKSNKTPNFSVGTVIRVASQLDLNSLTFPDLTI